MFTVTQFEKYINILWLCRSIALFYEKGNPVLLKSLEAAMTAGLQVYSSEKCRSIPKINGIGACFPQGKRIAAFQMSSCLNGTS